MPIICYNAYIKLIKITKMTDEECRDKSTDLYLNTHIDDKKNTLYELFI